MTTLFVGDLHHKASKIHISQVFSQIGLFNNLIVTRHAKRRTKIAFFDVGINELEKFLGKPIVIKGVEHYAQLSQNQPNISLGVLEIQKRRLFVEKLPKGQTDSDLEAFFKKLFGEGKIYSFFSVKNRFNKRKGYGFLHVSDKHVALEILKIRKVKCNGKTIVLKPFKQKFKEGVMAQIERLQNELQQSEPSPFHQMNRAEHGNPENLLNRQARDTQNLRQHEALRGVSELPDLYRFNRRNSPKTQRAAVFNNRSSLESYESFGTKRLTDLYHLHEMVDAKVLDKIRHRSRFLNHNYSNVLFRFGPRVQLKSKSFDDLNDEKFFCKKERNNYNLGAWSR
jgi:RNA recognition motif-containing protein